MVGSKVGAADFSNEIGLNGSGAATVKPPASPPQEDSAQKNPAPENSSQENSAPDAPAPANSAQRCPATEDSALESLALDGSAQGSPALDNPTLDNPTLDNPTLDNPALDNSAPDRFALEGSVLEGGPWAGADSADVTGVGRPDVGQGRPAVDEGRTAGQRRADMAAELFEIMLWNGLDWLGRRLPDQHRRRPHIEVLIPVGTLLGLDDEPCQLTGYGPIPAEMARRISTDGTWRRLLTDPTNGAVLQASTNRHDPGSLVSETLLAAHSVCDWINCSRPARECDRDHGTPFAQTGTTNLTDLRSYCEFHHVIKDTPAWGWNAANNPDGSTTLTTPTGHRYTTVPPRPGPVTTPSPTDDSPPPF
ncbi:hypothetical protein F1D05_25795 [Kribbella qitaiheensis]|uniref:DUF222 domain-containing protein n=1 Tax=Kribbella qitaiheensis TaxID=1544730 RepID=A0A7G6X386_9ACTN|nr:hypothetical protein [Kribbella qitaiheensis]QNE20701.1 hypothetical protein F1D05_25795 [Kribbella qitaiheensis]